MKLILYPEDRAQLAAEFRQLRRGGDAKLAREVMRVYKRSYEVTRVNISKQLFGVPGIEPNEK